MTNLGPARSAVTSIRSDVATPPGAVEAGTSVDIGPEGAGLPATEPAAQPRPRMARLRAFGREVAAVFRDATRRFAAARADLLGAGLAFHVLTSLAPLLLVSLAVLSIFVNIDNAAAAWRTTVAQLVGRNVADVAIGWVRAARHQSGTATVLGTVLFLLGSSRLYVHLRSALCAVFRVPVIEEDESWGQWFGALLRRRLVGAGAGMVAAATLGATVVVDVVLGVFASKIFPAGASASALDGLRVVVSFAVLSGAFAVLYRSIPGRTVSRRHAFGGALVTASAVMVANALLSFYFGIQSHFEVYGPATSVIAVLVWLVWTSQVVLFGAAITASMDRVEHVRLGASHATAPVT